MLATVIVGLGSIGLLAVGIMGFRFPHKLTQRPSAWETDKAHRIVVAVIAVFGVAVGFAAPFTFSPFLLQALAALLVVAAIVLALIGRAGYQFALAWWAQRPEKIVKPIAAAAAAVGAFLLLSIIF